MSEKHNSLSEFYNLFRLIFLKNYAIISIVKEGLVPLVAKKEQLMNKNPSIVSMAVTAKNFVGGGVNLIDFSPRSFCFLQLTGGRV